MVDAPQPATNEGYRPSIRIHSMKANLRHTGRTKSLTLNHPLNQDHVCPNRSAHIRQCLCRFSGERCTSEAIDEWQWNGGSGEEHYEYRLFLAARSSFRCEQPSSCVGALRLALPKIFRYANSHSRMYRGSDVFAEVQRYFYENSVYGSKIAVVFPA